MLKNICSVSLKQLQVRFRVTLLDTYGQLTFYSHVRAAKDELLQSEASRQVVQAYAQAML